MIIIIRLLVTFALLLQQQHNNLALRGTKKM